MNTILQGLQGVLCYIDDILVSGEDEASHFELLGEVFSLLEKKWFPTLLWNGTFIVYITYTSCMYVCAKGVA